MSKAAIKQTLDVGGTPVTVSNLDKVFYPRIGFTKGEMLDYYIRVAPFLLPHLKNRPLTFKRYPNGVEGDYFYEKQCPKPIPSFVKTLSVPHHHSAGWIQYCLPNNLPTLVWAANLGDLELHTFLAKAPNIQRPSSVVFDLDPGAPADAVHCARVALLLRDWFDAMRLQLFVKSSGSKGMQAYLPLNTPCTYEETRLFAKAVAQKLEQNYPDLVTSKMKREVRGGKVFVDWSQNAETKTTVCVYSLRAKERPFVSMPLEWIEIELCAKKQDASLVFFESAAALKRLEKLGDLFAPVLTLKQKIRSPVKLIDSQPDVDRAKPRSSPRTTDVSEYNRKRKFDETSEPVGKTRNRRKKDPIFVIQKHDASHLHYDFRLEMDGVLKSWAVPKGPPYDKKTKRLAVMVEDHPLEYASFEGTIPEGNYGAGIVMIWDTGTWEDLGAENDETLENGKIHFRLCGKKLEGDWALVKLRGPRAPKGNEWLLIKHGDDMKPMSARMDNQSAFSGKSLNQIATAD